MHRLAAIPGKAETFARAKVFSSRTSPPKFETDEFLAAK